MSAEKSSFNQLEQKFQCMVHELRNDTDWVNIKRSIVRAPQILKQKLSSTQNSTDDKEYAILHDRFISVDDALQVLERELLSSVYHFKQMLDHSIAMCDALSKLFDPNLESTITSENTNSAPVKDGYDRFVSTTKFASKLREIQSQIIPNLELILNNVREPICKALGLTKNIKRAIKDRQFALLDMNKYSGHLDSLNSKDKSILTLKQEQNIIRYEKNLELSRVKFERVNEVFKRELPYFNGLVIQMTKPLLTVLYFLNLTIHYHLLDLNLVTADDQFKLRTTERDMSTDQFGSHIIENYHKKHRQVKQKLQQLDIIKSALERSVRQQMESLSVSTSSSFYDAASLARTEPVYCTAEFNFDAEQQGDLLFKKGDKIRIMDKSTLSGDWWRGELNGKTGIFPRNYVTI